MKIDGKLKNNGQTTWTEKCLLPLSPKKEDSKTFSII